MPDYIWIEYTKPSELFSITQEQVGDMTGIRRKVEFVIPIGQRTLFNMYSKLIVSDSYFGAIEGVGQLSIPLPSVSNTPCAVEGYFRLDQSKWAGGLSIEYRGNALAGYYLLEVTYTSTFYLYRLARTSPIKAVHLTEQTGDRFAKIPIIR